MKKYIKFIILIIFILLCITNNVYADDTYYLTPSQEILAWNKWHADLGNYYVEEFNKTHKYDSWRSYNKSAEIITFTIDKNKKITDINVILYNKSDQKAKYKIAELYGDVCKKYNLAPNELFLIHYSDNFNIETDKKTKITGDNNFKSMMFYNFTKSLENNDILTFPEGTKRNAIKVRLNLHTLEKNEKIKLYTESEFNDYEVIEL